VKIGIIGYGRLGKLLVNYLSKDADCFVYDKNMKQVQLDSKKSLLPSSLEEVCQCPIIIPCVPISSFEETISSIVPIINNDALVIDVCSVKEHPIQIMLKLLPNTVSILGSHPMFGPDSAKDTLYGRKIVLCKIRLKDETYNNLKSYLESHGIKVVESTAEDHDRQISHSLVLSHLIGRCLIDMDIKEQEIDTKGYRRLIKILDQVENDSWQLFEDMNNYNRFSKDSRENFLQAANQIIKRLNPKT